MLFRILYTLLFALGPALAQNPALPEQVDWDPGSARIIEPQKYQWEKNAVLDFVVDNFDQDRDAEIVIIRDDKHYGPFLVVRELYSNLYAHYGEHLPTLYNPEHSVLTPLTGQQRIHSCLYYPSKEGGIVRFFDHRMHTIDSLKTIRGFDNNNDGIWHHSQVRIFRALDINKDGSRDLVFIINTASDGQPRAVLAYDLHSHEKIFDRRFAPMIQNFQIIDFNGDGNHQFLISLGGAGDGPFFGQFRRNESYLIIMNTDGTIQKTWTHFGPNTYITFLTHDINNDQVPDIIAVFFARSDNDKGGSFIRIIDGATFETICTHRSESGEQIYMWPYLLHSEQQNPPWLLTGTTDGIMHIYEFAPGQSRLELIRSMHPANFNINLKIYDFNQDGTDEILMNERNTNTLYILDHTFTVLAKIPLSHWVDRIQFVPPQNGHSGELFILANQTIYRAPVEEEDLYPPPAARFFWNGSRLNLGQLELAGLLALFIFALVISGIYLFNPRSQNTPQALIDSNRVGTLIINQNEHVIWCNAVVMSLLRLRKTSRKKLEELTSNSLLSPLLPIYRRFASSGKQTHHQELLLGESGEKQCFAVELSRVTSKVVQVLLIDLTESAQTERLKIWAALAQRLVHKTKTPLGSVMLSVQRLQRQFHKNNPEQTDIYDPYVRTILTEIERVRHDVNDFLRLARMDQGNMKKTDLVKSLSSLIKTYKKNMSPDITIREEIEAKELPVMLDENQYSEAMVNVLDNAVAAAKEKGNILVMASSQKNPLHDYGGGEEAVIEIVDDGYGIPKSEFNKLFTRGYTTSEYGSGLGLLIAKTIIEKYNGDISISSRENIGTTVTIRLPLVKEKSKETSLTSQHKQEDQGG